MDLFVFINKKNLSRFSKFLKKAKQVVIVIILIFIIIPQTSLAFDPSGYWWLIVNNKHEELIYLYIQSKKVRIPSKNKFSNNFIYKQSLVGTWDKPKSKVHLNAFFNVIQSPV